MGKQGKIKELYFNNKYSQKDIAKELNVSAQYVSKVLLKDDRYKKEKNNRKALNNKEHTKKTVDYIKKQRILKASTDYEILRQMHIQASKELSQARNISNRAFRNWNSSIYKYNDKTKSYHLKRGIVTGMDVPKRISWKNL